MLDALCGNIEGTHASGCECSCGVAILPIISTIEVFRKNVRKMSVARITLRMQLQWAVFPWGRSLGDTFNVAVARPGT